MHERHWTDSTGEREALYSATLCDPAAGMEHTHTPSPPVHALATHYLIPKQALKGKERKLHRFQPPRADAMLELFMSAWRLHAHVMRHVSMPLSLYYPTFTGVGFDPLTS